MTESETLPEDFWDWYTLKALFGDTPATRILQFLTVHRGSDYPLKELARQTHTGYRTFYRYIPTLLQLGVLKETRRIGAAKLYQLNEKSPITKYIQRLALEVAMKNAEEKGMILEPIPA